jgi:hypothetical protein
VDAAVATHPAVVAEWLAYGPDHLARIVAEACPGPASEPMDTWLGQVGKGDGGGVHPQLWRIAAAQIPRHPQRTWPVAVPLLDESHLQITTTPATRATAETMIEQLLMRVLSTIRPGLVRVHVWDAREMAGSLPALYPLMREGLLTAHDPVQLGDLLDELNAHIRAVRTRVQQSGRRSLREQALVESDGVRDEPWTIAVLFGDGASPDPMSHAALQRIGRSAHPAGVSLITVDLPVHLQAPTETIALDGRDNLCSMTGARARLIPDLPAAPGRVAAAARAIAEAYGEWRLREAAFADLLPPTFGTCSAANGITGPIGFTDDHQSVPFSLGDATPHALVGGPSGSGKTNLILASLASLCSRYSPDELELYLLDFKEGVSFAQLAGEQWLPHARLIGININDDREFGLELLRRLQTELVVRAGEARTHGVADLAGLRRVDPEQRPWPRIVAVIDEFHVLFTPRNDPVTHQAVAVLEDIARRGRAFGIHLVLASQDVGSIDAFWVKNGIFDQFRSRIGLPGAAGVLDHVNDATTQLPDHHAVVNTAGGALHGNQGARIPNASRAGTMDELIIALHALWGEKYPAPILLDGSVDIPPQTLWPTSSTVPTVVVGKGFTGDGDPTAAELHSMPGRNVAVVGATEREATRVLGCAAAGLALQGVDLDLVALEPLGARHRAAVAGRVPTARLVGHDGDDFEPYLLELVAEIEARLNGADRTPRAVVMWEVDAADTRLSPEGRQALLTVIHHGPEVGVHVIGWWRSVNRLRSLLMSPAVSPEDFGVWVVLDVIGSTIGSLIPDMVAEGWEPRLGRGFLYDRLAAGRWRQLFMVPVPLGGS